MNSRPLIVSAAIAAWAITSSIATADFVTFDLVWEGIDGSNASATGSVTIDTSSSIIANGGVFGFVPIDDSPYMDFAITIIDAAAGNGTFTQADGDFAIAFWRSSGPLDLSTNLVGQAGFLDMNVAGAYDGTPFAAGPFRLETNHNGIGGSDLLELTSMTANTIAVVPLPPAAWAGLGLLGVMAVRQRLSR